MSNISRPFVSVFLVAYNQEKYIDAATAGAFAQTYPNLEIVLSDDCSIDGTFDKMRRAAERYKGPHTVRLNRNKPNRGIVPHVNRCAELCRGEIIVGMAGDDISRPERVARLVNAYHLSGGRLDAICSWVNVFTDNESSIGITTSGPPGSSLGDIRFYAAGWQCHVGASEAWHRRVFEDFGPMHPESPFEDVLLGFRAALRGGIAMVPEILVDYRQHTSNAFNLDVGPDGRAIVANYQRNIARFGRAIEGMRRDLDFAKNGLAIAPEKIAVAQEALDSARTRAVLEEKMAREGRGKAFRRLLGSVVRRQTNIRSAARMAIIHLAPSSLYGWIVRRNTRRNKRLSSVPPTPTS